MALVEAVTPCSNKASTWLGDCIMTYMHAMSWEYCCIPFILHRNLFSYCHRLHFYDDHHHHVVTRLDRLQVYYNNLLSVPPVLVLSVITGEPWHLPKAKQLADTNFQVNQVIEADKQNLTEHTTYSSQAQHNIKSLTEISTLFQGKPATKQAVA
jgi:hypothetical protein